MRQSVFSALVTLLAACGIAKAEIILDQQQGLDTGVTTFGDPPPVQAAQTFIVGAEGRLVCIDVGLDFIDSRANLTYAVHSTTGGVPNSTVLGGGTVPTGSLTTGVNSIDVEPGIFVSVGDQLAIVLGTSTNIRFGWDITSGQDPYPGGALFLLRNNIWENESNARTQFDAVFSTYVDTGRIDPFLPSDLTGNGVVDFQDLTILLANWNEEDRTAQGNIVLPCSTPVNFEDLTVLLADWTGPAPAGSPEAALGTEAVPEPSTLLLALLATLGLSFYRRRRRRAF